MAAWYRRSVHEREQCIVSPSDDEATFKMTERKWWPMPTATNQDAFAQKLKALSKPLKDESTLDLLQEILELPTIGAPEMHSILKQGTRELIIADPDATMLDLVYHLFDKKDDPSVSYKGPWKSIGARLDANFGWLRSQGEEEASFGKPAFSQEELDAIRTLCVFHSDCLDDTEKANHNDTISIYGNTAVITDQYNCITVVKDAGVSLLDPAYAIEQALQRHLTPGNPFNNRIVLAQEPGTQVPLKTDQALMKALRDNRNAMAENHVSPVALGAFGFGTQSQPFSLRVPNLSPSSNTVQIEETAISPIPDDAFRAFSDMLDGADHQALITCFGSFFQLCNLDAHILDNLGILPKDIALRLYKDYIRHGRNGKYLDPQTFTDTVITCLGKQKRSTGRETWRPIIEKWVFGTSDDFDDPEDFKAAMLAKKPVAGNTADKIIKSLQDQQQELVLTCCSDVICLGMKSKGQLEFDNVDMRKAGVMRTHLEQMAELINNSIKAVDKVRETLSEPDEE